MEMAKDRSHDSSSSFQQPDIQFENINMWALAVLSFICSFVAFSTLAPIFVTYTPDHRCKLSNSSSYFPVHGDFINHHCQRLALPHNSQSLLINQSAYVVEDCIDGWVYNGSQVNTMSTEFNLVCNLSWLRPLVTASTFVGCLVSGVTGGALLDRFGRKRILSISIAFYSVFSLIGSFSSSIFMVLPCQFVIGAALLTMYYPSFVLAQELVPVSKRALATTALNLGYTSGYFFLTLSFYLIRDWRWLYRLATATSAVYLPIFIWVVPESTKWLQRRGTKEGTSYSQGMKLDSTKQESQGVRIYLTEQEADSDRPEKTLRCDSGLGNSVLVKRCILVCLMWVVCNVGFYTLNLNSSNLGGNIYINSSVGASVDAVSYLFAMIWLKKVGRRKSFACCIGVASIFCLSTPSFNTVHTAMVTTSSMLGKLFMSCSISIAIVWAGELFPTNLRSTYIGIASTVSSIFTTATPFVVYAGEAFDRSIPFYLTGSIGLMTMLLSALLPETSDTELPDTMDEALSLDGRRLKFVQAACSSTVLKELR